MGEPAAEPDWEALVRHAGEFGVLLSGPQVAALQRYLELLCRWNQRFNLTAVDRPDEILVKHFLDSLSCALVVDFTQHERLLDVGTGAGFPGLVLKIAFPHLDLTLLDAIQKRLGFLRHVADELELDRVVTVHARAEDAAAPRRSATPAGRGAARRSGAANRAGTEQRIAGERLREAFDVVTARAVARLNVLAEWVVPFVKVGGVAVAMKGPEIEEELEDARRALDVLGGGPPTTRTLTLPGTDIGRSLVMIPKLRATPQQYPRLPGSARKAPL